MPPVTLALVAFAVFLIGAMAFACSASQLPPSRDAEHGDSIQKGER